MRRAGDGIDALVVNVAAVEHLSQVNAAEIT